MVSVSRAAIEMYAAAQKDINKILEEKNATCNYSLPLKYKKGLFWGTRADINPIIGGRYDRVRRVEVEMKGVDVSGGRGPRKSHPLSRFLIESVDWSKRKPPNTVELYINSSKNPTVLGSSTVTGLHRKEKDSIVDTIFSYGSDKISFKIDFADIDILDTILFLYTGEEPRIENFSPRSVMRMYRDVVDGEVSASIMDIPELEDPKPEPEKIYVGLKDEGIRLPRDDIIFAIQNHREGAYKRNRETEELLKATAGRMLRKLSCEIRETSFWRGDGIEIFGKISEFGAFGLWDPTWLDYLKIVFSDPLPMRSIGPYLNKPFDAARLTTDTDTYLNTVSALDLIADSSLSVDGWERKISSYMIRGKHIGKRGINKLLELAEKVSYVA